MNEREPMATTDPAEIEALIERIESGQVCAGDAQLVGRLLRLMLVLLSVLSGKNASLARLRRLLFGTKSERRMKAEAQEQQALAANGSQPVNSVAEVNGLISQ